MKGYCIESALEGVDNISKQMEGLSPYQRDMLGCFCLLDQRITRENFPNDIPMIYFRNDQVSFIRPELRKAILDGADETMLMRWHSKAADWCLDNVSGITDRIYHLVMAQRDREAMRLIKDRKYAIMDSMEPKFMKCLPLLLKRHDDIELKKILARLMIRTGTYDQALRTICSVTLEDPVAGLGLSSELLIRQHRIEEAYRLVSGAEYYDPMILTSLGICQLWYGRPVEARSSFMKARELMINDHCIFNMDVLLAYEAFALIHIGERKEAMLMMSAAVAVCRNVKRKADLSSLCDRLFPVDSENGILLEGVDIRDVKVPDVLYVPLEHRKPLETESPCEDRGLDSEWCKDLGPEHSSPSELHPLAVEEDLDLQ